MRSRDLFLLLAVCGGCRAVNGPEEPVIRVEVTVARTTFVQGEPIGITVRITNPSASAVYVDASCDKGLNVRNGVGTLVYPFPASGIGTCISPAEPLAAGATITRRLAWATHRVSPSENNGVVVFVDPGTYLIRAVVRQALTSHDVESAPQTITITAPPG